MTENKTKKTNSNVVGATKLATPDGSAKAVVTLSMLSVNNDIKPNSIDSGTFLKFPTSIYGEFGINKLSRAMNDIQLVQTQFGVSANVSIFVKNAAQLAYLTEKLKKGAKLRSVHAVAKFDPKYGLQLSVQPGDIAFIETDEKQSDAAEETKEAAFDVESTGI